MGEPVSDEPYLVKAERSLLGAESEYANERYENCINRGYYACFQAAIAALRQSSVPAAGNQWSHGFVQGQFVGQLINRRHRYPPALRSVLTDRQTVRNRADYGPEMISEVEAYRGLCRAREFVTAVRQTGAGRR